ncbi:MAG: hypothetical protein M1272_00790 [Firmicutes bacterium]|nr:hypothetical protein [Bacillota bacterium]
MTERVPGAGEGLAGVLELKSIADRIRRQPLLARELDVSVLAQEVAGRWREHSDMLQASEEVPVAAWIVKKKVEGLIRPDEPEEEAVGFDESLRPAWLDEALGPLQALARSAEGYIPGSAVALDRPPAPVKDPSPWKLAWSYPVLRPKKEPPPRVVAREAEPLQHHMQRLLDQVERARQMDFHSAVAGRPRPEWVAQFLAAVHLWHARTIDAAQETPFGAIQLAARAQGDDRR